MPRAKKTPLTKAGTPRIRKPGGGRKRKHTEGSRLQSVMLAPPHLAWIEDSGMTAQAAIVQAIETSPAFQIWRGAAMAQHAE